jgi:hypothetical protein
MPHITEVEKILRDKIKDIEYLTRLRSYQREGFVKVILSFTQRQKPIRHLCTGAGKSIEQSALIRYYYELGKARGSGRKILMVGEKDEIIINARQQLINIGISDSEIGIIKNGYRLELHKPIQIASIPTLRRRYEKWAHLPIATDTSYFELIVIDECHHAHNGADKSYKDLWTRYSEAKIVGYTATPESDKGFTNLFDLIISGESQIELAHLGYLPYWESKGIQCKANLENIPRIKGEFEQKALDKALKDSLLQGDILPTWEKYVRVPYGIIPTIIFARSVTLSKEYAACITDNSNYKAVHIDGAMGSEQIKSALRQFASGEATFLVNCQKAIEGFDLATYAKSVGLEFKSIGCVQDLAPTLSIKRHKQKVGRARGFLWDGKLKAIYLDHWGAYKEFGTPDQPYNWTLEGVATRVGETTKRCPDEDFGCGATDVLRTAKVCPYCGYMFPVIITVFEKDESIPHNKGIELIPIIPDELALYNNLLSNERVDGWAIAQFLNYAPTFQTLLALATQLPNADVTTTFSQWITGQRKIYGNNWKPSVVHLLEILEIIVKYQRALRKTAKSKPLHIYNQWLELIRDGHSNYLPTSRELWEIAKVCGYDSGWVHYQVQIATKKYKRR